MHHENVAAAQVAQHICQSFRQCGVIYPKHLNLRSDIQSLLSNATPLSNDTVEVIISTSSENVAQPLLENLTIKYLLVEPPKVFSVEPLPEGNALRISWKGNGDDATHYHLLSNATGMWEVLMAFPAEDGHFDHTGLVDGVTYYYIVSVITVDLRWVLNLLDLNDYN